MKYHDYIKVNENFQYSVNLQFDLNNIDKIRNYIPTKDGCEIIKFYVNSILNGKNRATSLIGPYGKGKSHLLLVLLMLLSDYDLSDKKVINELLEKIKKIDLELFDLLSNVRNNELKLLPIIINSNYDDLNQAFMLGINDALERVGINDIVIDTSFDVARNILIDWHQNHSEINGSLKKCFTDSNTTFDKLEKGLKKYDKKAYDVFKNVYECITHGQSFNPLVNNDIIKNFKDITHLLDLKGYTGIFIAFDEFSKFLDVSDSNSIMKDLKILQDFAELANRTGKSEQIHLSCITHKGMSEYVNDDDQDKINAYKTVEGRFKNIYFNRSMEQNYEIVSYALEKQKGFDDFYEEYLNKNAYTYLSLKDLTIFNNTVDIEQILFKGCFPLNPVTTYSLIELSEKIAQNERTLFTFLTDDDSNGLKSFVKTNSTGLFNIDKVYDYFESLFKSTVDSKIKDIWYKATNILRKNISIDAKRIIKSVSIIFMINELDELNTNVETVRLSLDMNEKSFNKALDELLEKSYLRKKKITDDLDFATMHSKQLTSDIKELVNNQFSDINEKGVLDKIIGRFYSLPRRFNEEYKMTRYFTNIFISESEIMNMSSFDIFHNQDSSDGIVLNLIRTSKNIDEIINHFRSISDDRAVLKISKLSFKKNFLSLLKEYEAVNYLINNNYNDEDVMSELELMKNELVNAIKDAYKYYFSDDNILEYVYLNQKNSKKKNLSFILSSICESVYSLTPIINNELINKNDLSAPIKKAREIVIESILENNYDLIKSKTSAEATIYKAIVDKSETESIKSIIEIIKQFIQSTDNNKKSFKDLYKTICSKPYSMRFGTIPVLIALAIRDYSDNIIFYYMNREIELNSINLVKINDNPENYYILTEKGTVDRIEYVNSLEKIFGVQNINSNIRLNVVELINSMKKWIFGLPRIIREMNIPDAENNIIDEYIKVKSELLRPDINNNEFLFVALPNIFNEKNKTEIVKKITVMKNSFDCYISNYLEKLIIDTKELINSKYKGSLSTLLMEWNKELDKSVKNNIYDIKTRNFIDYLDNLNTHDEHDVIEKLSKIFTSFYVEDWQVNQKDEYISNFKSTIAKLNDKTNKEDNSQRIIVVNNDKTIEKNLTSSDNISALGNTMKNNIEEIIEEYGSSISEEEKVNILLNIMKKFM